MKCFLEYHMLGNGNTTGLKKRQDCLKMKILNFMWICNSSLTCFDYRKICNFIKMYNITYIIVHRQSSRKSSVFG